MIWRKILLFILCFNSSGCATIGKESYLKTNAPEEQKLLCIEDEIKFGHYVDAEIQNEYMVLNNSELQEKLDQIFEEIVAKSDRNDLDFKLRILNSSEINAFAGPGGYVYITTGLLGAIKNKDEFAGVVAHEIGHICARHTIKRFYGTNAANNTLAVFSALAQTGSIATTGDASAGQSLSDLSSVVAIISLQGYSRQDELQADSLAVKYVEKASYNVLAVLWLLKRIEEYIQKATAQEPAYTLLSSHPSISDREKNIRAQITNLK